MRAQLKQGGVLLAVALAVFVFKAFVPIPLFFSRGLVGAGLYRLINAGQFYETAGVTLLVCLWTARRLRLAWARALVAAVGCGVFNFGLQVLDARLQTYAPYLEEEIASRYGDPVELLALGAFAALAGLVALGSSVFARFAD